MFYVVRQQIPGTNTAQGNLIIKRQQGLKLAVTNKTSSYLPSFSLILYEIGEKCNKDKLPGRKDNATVVLFLEWVMGFVYTNRSGIPTPYKNFVFRVISSPPIKTSFLGWVMGFVCIFAKGKNKCAAPSRRRRQQSTGLLHLHCSNPITPMQKPLRESGGVCMGWVRQTAFHSPYRLRSAVCGFSPGLKKCPPDTFLPCYAVPSSSNPITHKYP